LAPSFPALPGQCRPTPRFRVPDLLSWGCPKIAPPSSETRVSTPGPIVPLDCSNDAAGPSRWECHFPSAFRPRGFSPPRRFKTSRTLPGYCTELPIMGFTAFHPTVRSGSPPCLSCPSKLSLRRKRLRSRTNLPPLRACVTASQPSLAAPRSPPALPSHPFSPAPSRIRAPSLEETRFGCGVEPGPQGLAPPTGPLPCALFPAGSARCSLGLG